MKILIAFFLLFASCNLNNKAQHKVLDDENERIYISSVSSDSIEINWYCYSSIGSFVGSKLDFYDKKNNQVKTVSCFYLSDFSIHKDTLKLQFWKNSYSDLDLRKISYFKIIDIDTTGDQNKNGLEARFSRLQHANIDFNKPHSFDSRAK